MNPTMSSSLPRTAYRLILRVHPAPFRKRFGEEMLWIFDQECERGARKLLIDGALSAVRQHAKEQDEHEPAPAGFTVEIATSGISLRRFVQGGVLASLIYGVMLLLTRNGVAIQPVQSAGSSCSTALRAPTHISYPPKPPGH
jgi:hypothetical protein